MNTTQHLRKNRPQSLLFLIGKLLSLLFLCNASSCECGGTAPSTKLNMVASSNLLIGLEKDEHGIESKNLTLTFGLGENNSTVALDKFYLRGKIVDQRNILGESTKNKRTSITYQHTTAGDKVILDAVNEALEATLLTDLLSVIELDPAAPAKKSTGLDFVFIPDQETVEIAAEFELLDESKTAISTAKVRWIKSEFTTSVPKSFSGRKSSIIINSLAKNISTSELKDYTIAITSTNEDAKFSVHALDKKDVNKANPFSITLDKLLQGPLYQGQTHGLLVYIDAKEDQGSIPFKVNITSKHVDTPLSITDGDWAPNDPNLGLSDKDNQLAKVAKQIETNKKVLRKAKEGEKELNKALEKAKNKGTSTETLETDLQNNKTAQTKLNEEIDKDKLIKKDLNNKIKTAKSKASSKDQESKTMPRLLPRTKNKLSSDTAFFIILENLGKNLVDTDLKEIKVWYEIQHAEGKVDHITVTANKESQTGGFFNKTMTTREIIQQGKEKAISLDNFTKMFAHSTEKHLSFEINGIQEEKSLESIQVILHFEGLDPTLNNTAYVVWEKHVMSTDSKK